MKQLQLSRWVFLLLQLVGVVVATDKIVLNATYGNIDGIEYIYQLPPVPRDQIKGVVFIAHGCNRRGTDWWPKSASCEKCIGMPLCQAVTYETLQHGYIALASSSRPREVLCWNRLDYPIIPPLLHHFYNNILHDTAYQLPLHLLGWSNGGYFLGGLVQHNALQLQPIKIASLVVPINPIKLMPGYSYKNKFPIPTMFILMKKDLGIYYQVLRIKPLFRNVTILLAYERPVTKSFLYEHGMGTVSLKESELVHSLLKKHGYLNESTDLLKQDPRTYNHWRQMLSKEAPELSERDTLVHDKSPIWEMLNSAFAYHEITDERNKQIFEFMDNMTMALRQWQKTPF